MKALLTIAAIAALLSGCATRIENTGYASTADLQTRRAELQRQFAENDFGIYFGPTRWISHATDERASRIELQKINAELARRQGVASTASQTARGEVLVGQLFNQ
jgi:hypothetical protein